MTSGAPVVEWTLLDAMARKRIRKASDLKRRLAAVGVDVSDAQLSRLINETPSRVSLDLLAGLATVLDCGTGDLLRLSFAGGRNRPRPDEAEDSGDTRGNGEPEIAPPPRPPRAKAARGKRPDPEDARTERVEDDGFVMPPKLGPLPFGDRVKP